MEPFYREFGDLLRRARQAKGVSQAAIAPSVGLSRTSVANIERGRQRMSIHLLMDFARALDVEPCTLLPAVQIEPDPTRTPGLLEFSPGEQEQFLTIQRRARKEMVDGEA